MDINASASKNRRERESIQKMKEEVENEIDLRAKEKVKDHIKSLSEKAKVEQKKITLCFVVLSLITLVVAVSYASVCEAYWIDFADFWVAIAKGIAFIFDTVRVFVWNIVIQVYNLVPVNVLDIIAAFIVGVVLYGTIPLIITLLIIKFGKRVWLWYKGGWTVEYFSVTVSTFFVSVFWCDQIKWEWWNCWAMWLLFVVVSSLISAYKVRKRSENLGYT